MKLVKGQCGTDCLAASLAMVTGTDLGYIEGQLFKDLPKPFPGKWSHLPKVPDMNVVCDWAWGDRGIALVPFEYDPQCTPHKDCPPEPVWPRSMRCKGDADQAFCRALDYGEGLLEGILVGRESSHMCAWSEGVIYDPRGYCYSRNVAVEYFNFQIWRFWLAVPTRK